MLRLCRPSGSSLALKALPRPLYFSSTGRYASIEDLAGLQIKLEPIAGEFGFGVQRVLKTDFQLGRKSPQRLFSILSRSLTKCSRRLLQVEDVVRPGRHIEIQPAALQIVAIPIVCGIY